MTNTTYVAAVYIRVSTKYQVDKDSLPFQEKQIKAYLKLIGIKKHVIFRDEGYSAKNTDRPEYQKMMVGIRQKKFTHLVVWKVDRISRNLLDFAELYQELKKMKVTFISLNEQFDTSSAIGEAMLKIILVFAELERNMTSERVMGIMLDRAENGLWNGARMPVGYRWNPETKYPEPDPMEKNVVQFIYDEYERVHSCLQISRLLNNNKVKTKRGGTWTSKLIHDIIRNPFYIGTYRYNLRESGRGPLKPKEEWIIKENNHTGIIQKDQFIRCNNIMDQNAQARNTSAYRGRKYVHIFSGHLVCENCGSNMVASKDRARSNGYRPSVFRCGKRARNMDCQNSKYVSELYLVPFIFRYIANMVHLKKNFKKINSLKDLERELLSGEEFKGIHISSNSLQHTFQILASYTSKRGIFSPNISFDSLPQFTTDEVELLDQEISRCKTAIERLTELYLYNPDAITREEYVKKKKELLDNISTLEERANSSKSKGDSDNSMDLSFIKKASAFLITQQIIKRNYNDYTQILLELDPEILKDFIDQTIDKIIINDGRVRKIVFINGLTHEFNYIIPSEFPICPKCGGRIGKTCGCRSRTFTFKDKTYRRIRVGAPGDQLEGSSNRCPDCSAEQGRWHHWGCRNEICPICGQTLASCTHGKAGK